MNLTNIPAGQLTGSVPSATLTSVPAGNLTGSVPVGTLPANLQALNNNNGGNLTNVQVTLPAGVLTNNEASDTTFTNVTVTVTNSGGFTQIVGSNYLHMHGTNGADILLDNGGNITASGTLTGSGAGLTSIPAGRLTGSVPSATLTSIPAANLTGPCPAAR